MKLQFLITALSFLSISQAQHAGIDTITSGVPLNFSDTIAPSVSKNKSTTAHFSQKSAKQDIVKIKAANIKQVAKTRFQYFIIKADNNRYGYCIYANGNLFIQQTTIPALSGTQGFSDTTSAATTAKLVIKKLKQGEMPPTITIQELKKIGVH